MLRKRFGNKKDASVNSQANLTGDRSASPINQNKSGISIVGRPKFESLVFNKGPLQATRQKTKKKLIFSKISSPVKKPVKYNPAGTGNKYDPNNPSTIDSVNLHFSQIRKKYVLEEEGNKRKKISHRSSNRKLGNSKLNKDLFDRAAHKTLNTDLNKGEGLRFS
jgi:hypothetical protein